MATHIAHIRNKQVETRSKSAKCGIKPVKGVVSRFKSV